MFPRTGVVSQLLRSSAGVSAQQRIVPGARRCFSNSVALKQEADASSLPAKKPVGAFRGGALGFLTGSVAAGAAVYYFILGEYRTANEMLTEDIYALQKATQQLQGYITELETKVDSVQRKR